MWGRGSAYIWWQVIVLVGGRPYRKFIARYFIREREGGGGIAGGGYFEGIIRCITVFHYLFHYTYNDCVLFYKMHCFIGVSDTNKICIHI